MTTVEIRDDPDHPEGGHALILFRGVAGPPGRATLLVEPLTEGIAYRGPRQIEAEGDVTDAGLVYAVADGALDQLAPGLAVALSVQGAGIAAEVLWPELTPLRIVTRRTGIRTAGPRRVVAQGAGAPAPRDAPASPASPAPPQPPKPKAPEPRPPDPGPIPGAEVAQHQADPGPPPPKPVPPRDPSAPPPLPETGTIPAEDMTGSADLPISGDDAIVPADHKPEPPAIVVAPAVAAQGGWRLPAVAAVAVLAFCAGAAASGAALMMRPTHVDSAALPSPYDLLHPLPDRSPDGTQVDMADAGDFLLRSRSAKTPEDGSFWRRWATRAMLETNAGGSAATLSDFAADLARSHTDAPTLAAARFLWELAALGQDCAAMQNIATALGVGGDKAKTAEIAAWQDREQQCRSQPSSAPN